MSAPTPTILRTIDAYSLFAGSLNKPFLLERLFEKMPGGGRRFYFGRQPT
jgi:hypothetical protein